MMEVPVPDLLQMTHPGYRMLLSRCERAEEDVIALVDFARSITERFEFYGSINVTAPDIFEMMQSGFLTMLVNDEPEVILPVRELMLRLLEEFEAMAQNMARAFSVAPAVKNVYHSLSEMLYECYGQLAGDEDYD